MAEDFIAEILEQPQALRRCVNAYPTDNSVLAEVGSMCADTTFRQIVLTGIATRGIPAIDGQIPIRSV